MPRALADCPACEGDRLDCERCRGTGVVSVAVGDDQFYSDLPVGWTTAHARALLSRIKTGRPVVFPELQWSPYPIGWI